MDRPSETPEGGRGGSPARRWLPIVAGLGTVLLVGSVVYVSLAPEHGSMSPASEGSWVEQMRQLLRPASASGSASPATASSREASDGPAAARPLGAALERRALVASSGSSAQGASNDPASPQPFGAAAGTRARSGAASEQTSDAALSGRVVDAMGGPIVGAAVAVTVAGRGASRSSRGASVAGAAQSDVQLVSDERGEFRGRVPAGWVYLEASSEAYAASRRSVLAPATDVELALTPAASIRGRVLSTQGQPIADARISAHVRGVEMRPLEASSDTRGQFVIDGVRAGVSELTASAPGFARLSQWVRLGVAEAETRVVLRLVAARSVVGRVLVDGRPCASGVVHEAGLLGSGSPLDADGRYRVDGLTLGSHALMAVCAGAAPDTRELRLTADSAPITTLDFELGAGLSITGTVRRIGGEPVEGAQVRVLAVARPPGATRVAAAASAIGIMGRAASECVSDARGAFECGGLAAGHYRVGAEALGGPAALSDPVVLDAASAVVVSLVVPDGGEVRVHVLPGPVGAARVQGAFARRDGQALSSLGMATETGFVFDHLALGRYRIGLSRELDLLGPGVAEIELSEPGQVVELDLAPPPALAISGRVLERDGTPVVDATVSVTPASALGSGGLDMIEPVLTNVAGAFETPGLAPGRYLVSAVHPAGEARQLDVGAGQTALLMELDAYGTLSGMVSLPDGALASAFTVLILRQPPGGSLHVDGSNGYWRAPWVAAGEYRIVVMSSSGGASANVSVEPGRLTAMTLRLDPALAGLAIANAAAR